MTAPSLPRNAVALLVGIGHYRRADRIAGLSFAARDARSVANLLRKEHICGFPPGRVVLLTDDKASRANVVRHLSRWLPKEAHGADLVLIYFAGHGTVESVGGREEGYLLPHDADPDDVVTHGVAMSDVARWIEGLDARAVLVCLDCCHAGGILPAQGLSLRTTERDMQIRPSHLEKLGGRGRFLIASCDRGQKSIESDELRHGLFTYHLLKGLRGAGDRDGDGRVGVAELFNYVAAAVSRDARERYQREQTPWTSATYNEDVLLSVVPAKAPPRSTVENASPDETCDDPPLAERLRQLRKKPDLAEIPFVFRNLAHRSESIRTRARQALAALAWERVAGAAERLVSDVDAVAALLDGLEALEAGARVISLLDRLAAALRGSQRDRAVWLLDRKRLAQERERLAAVFRETKSIYEIVKVLGPGTYTGAYLARQEMTGLEVVIRVLRAEYAAQPMVRSHFLELGTKAVRLVHQNLVLTREARALPESGLYFTVRDYIPGVTLRQVLESGRRFEPPQARKILRQVLDALVPLHRDGLVHAGVKPSNIFLTRDDHVILGDPSLPLPAVGLDLPRLAYDFRYAPPELFRAGGLVPASDLYALGCVAFELFQGQPPFVADSPFELIARHERDAPPLANGDCKVQGWLARLLAKKPAERFATLDEARRRLDDLETARRPEPQIDRINLTMPAPSHAPKPLLRDQSFLEFEGRQSLVPLSRADGGPPGTSADESIAYSDSAPPSLPGYEILEVLGRGGMGVVYKARQIALGRVVALKMILAGGHAGPNERHRFQREAHAVAAVDHPNIVQVYDLGVQDGLPYLALEFCPGGSLSSRLARDPKLSPREAASLVTQLSLAVQAAHAKGIIHRDLKPGNILFDAAGQPKITDFGLARHASDEDNLTRSGAIVGTPSYMAPEQAQGRKDITPATDVYALGAIFYECLTGQRPFHGATAMDLLMAVASKEPVPPRHLNAAIPHDLEAICLKCLKKAPTERYPSAGALAEDLHRWLEGVPVTARKVRRGWWPF